MASVQKYCCNTLRFHLRLTTQKGTPGDLLNGRVCLTYPSVFAVHLTISNRRNL